MDETEIIMYNVEDIMRIFHMGRSKAYQLVNSDGFPRVRLNNKILVPKSSLEDWIQKHTKKQHLF
jgi:predicted DNA-binding transcriptional regulator AlpA